MNLTVSQWANKNLVKNKPFNPTEEEIWKYIPQYDGYLQASSFGRIREYQVMIKSDGKPHVIKNKILNIQNNGNLAYKTKTIRAQHLIFSAFFHIPIRGTRVFFKDGNPLNRRPENLFYSGQALKGEENYKAKLTNQKVYALCLDYINGINASILSEKYGIHMQNVYRVVYNLIWESVERPSLSRNIIKKDKAKLIEFFQSQLTSKK